MRRISHGVSEDLKVWREFLTGATGEKKFRFLFPEDERSHTISTDASASIGYGPVMEGRWFSGTWDDGGRIRISHYLNCIPPMLLFIAGFTSYVTPMFKL